MEETPLQKAIRLAKESQSEKSVPTDIKELTYEDYLKKKERSEAGLSNGSKTSGGQSPASPNDGSGLKSVISPVQAKSSGVLNFVKEVSSLPKYDSKEAGRELYREDATKATQRLNNEQEALDAQSKAQDAAEQKIADKQLKDYQKIHGQGFVSGLQFGATYLGSKLAKGALSMAEGGAAMYGKLNPMVEPVLNAGLEKLHEGSDLGLNKDYQGMGIVDKTIGGLIETVPALATAEFGGWFLSGLGNAHHEVEEAKNNGAKFENGSDDAYMLMKGLANELAMKELPISKFLNKTPSPLREAVTSKIALEAFKKAANSGEKLTAETLMKPLIEEAKTFSQKAVQGGINFVKDYAHTAKVLGGLTISDQVAKNMSDKLGGADNFDESPENLAAGIKQSLIDAGAFTVLGSAMKGMTDPGALVRKSPIHMNVLKSLREDSSDANLQRIHEELVNHGTEQGWDEDHIQSTTNALSSIHEAVNAIPKQFSDAKFNKAVDLITGRKELEKELSEIKASKETLDESLRDVPTKEEALIEAKVEQGKDKLRELATDKKFQYSFDGENGSHTKQLGSDGKPEQISQERYELENLERAFKKQADPEAKVSVPDGETPSNVDVNEVPSEPVIQKDAITEITPNKKIKANQKLATNEVSVKRGVKPSEGDVLYSQFKKIGVYDPLENSYLDKPPANTFISKEDIPPIIRKNFEALEKKGFVESYGEDYYLTESGKEFIDAVNTRLETRKGIKDGTDMFPEDAGLSPEEVAQLSKRVTPEETKVADETFDNDHEINTQDIIDYEQDKQRGTEAEPLPETVQQPGNDRGADAQENTSGAGVEGEQTGGTATGYGSESGEPTLLDKIFNQHQVDPILDFLETLKIKQSGVKSVVLPIAELYNSAIDIIKAAVKTGNTLANSIRLAKDYLRERGAKENEIKGFEKSIINHVEVENEKRPTLKQIIKENTDRRAKGKITLTELQALKKQIKDTYAGFGRGYKEALHDQALKLKEASQITEALRAQIGKILNEAEKNHVLPGDISSKTLANVVKKINDAGSNPGKLLGVIDYVGQVIDNLSYDADIQLADKSRAQIKAKVKSKSFSGSSTSKAIVNAFLKLKPSSLEALSEYNSIAKQILSNLKGLTVNKDGIENESLSISNQQILDFVDAQLKFQNDRATSKLLEDFKDLVDAGIIDKDSMTLSEMKQIIEGIHSGDTSIEETLLDSKVESYGKKVRALKAVIDPKFIELNDYLNKQRVPLGDGTMQSMLTDQEKEIVKNIHKVDTSKLDLRQLAKLNDVINEIIQNDNFTGSGDMSILADVQASTVELAGKVTSSGIKLGSIGNSFIQGFASTNLMPEFIFKSTKVAAEAQRLSGISDVFNGHARARIEQNKTMKQFMDLKKSLGSGIDTPINRYRRGIYARVIQHYGGMEGERLEEFKRVKELIRQTGDKLASSNHKDYPEEVKEGKLIQALYAELLDGSHSAEEVRERLIRISPANIKLVDFWKDKYEAISDKMAESTEIYDNKVWEDVAEYTATKMKAVSGGSLTDSQQEKDIFESRFFAKKPDNSPAKTKIARAKIFNIPKNAALDLDFDKIQSRKYYESLYDIETNKAISKVRVMLTEPKVAELFGGNKNLKIIQESIRTSVALQKGNVPVPDALQRTITTTANMFQAKGARIALGSVSQLLKQYPSVALDAMVVLGKDLPLYFKALTISNDLPLFEKYNIGLRGTTRAGYSKEVDLNLIDGIKFETDLNSALSKVGEISKNLAEKSLKMLEVSDAAVARTSWLSFYMQDLKRQGIDINSVDWKVEHLTPNNEAAAYAEQQVSRNQNANDGSSMGEFYKQSGNAYANVFKSIFLPFSTFSVNQRVRMTNDLQKLVYGGEKAEAAKSLAATVVEQAAFNYIKGYLIASITTAGANSLLHAFGFGDDEIQENKYRFQKFVSNTFSDYFFSGMGSLPKTLLEKGSNSLYNLVSDDKKTQLFYQFDPSRYGQPDLSAYGIYSVPFLKAYQAGKMVQYLDGETTKITKGGSESKHHETEVPMQKNEFELARVLFAVEALGLIGISDADVSQMNAKATQQFQKHMGKKYGGTFNMKMYSTELNAR